MPDDPSPLTLSCLCSEEGICELTGLKFVYTYKANSTQLLIHHQLTLSDGVHSVLIDFSTGGEDDAPSGSGEHSLDIDDWFPNFDSISVAYLANSGLFQPGGVLVYSDVVVNVWMQMDYTCTGSGETRYFSLASYPTQPPKDDCDCTDGTQILAHEAVVGGTDTNPHGSLRSMVFKTSTFDGCQGCTVTASSFFPSPHGLFIGSEQMCLCADGGTPPYFFAVTRGRIPSGQTLNRATGCIDDNGTPGDIGSPSVTFVVVDSTNAYAFATCDFIRTCPDGGDPDDDIGNETT